MGLGEAGNFPAAIKVTAEYFPKKDRAFATSIFNAGASVGALAAPATIPLLAKSLGWEMAFIIIGLLGFVWAAVWIFVYDKPAAYMIVFCICAVAYLIGWGVMKALVPKYKPVVVD